MKKHRDACESLYGISAVAEHAWSGNSIKWKETSVLDHTRRQELPLNEVMHIQVLALNYCYNRDDEVEVLSC